MRWVVYPAILFLSLFEGTMATSDRTWVKIRNFFIEMEVIAEFAEVFFDQSFGGSLDSFGSDSSLTYMQIPY